MATEDIQDFSQESKSTILREINCLGTVFKGVKPNRKAERLPTPPDDGDEISQPTPSSSILPFRIIRKRFAEMVDCEDQPPQKPSHARGRPPGSKNKPKTNAAVTRKTGRASKQVLKELENEEVESDVPIIVRLGEQDLPSDSSSGKAGRPRRGKLTPRESVSEDKTTDDGQTRIIRQQIRQRTRKNLRVDLESFEKYLRKHRRVSGLLNVSGSLSYVSKKRTKMSCS